MNTQLGHFLEANESESVWFVIPGGLALGHLGTIPVPNTGTVTLKGAFYVTGSSKLFLSEMDVLIEDISAWGTKKPELITDLPD